jgi:hypothetical protein
MSLAQQLLDGIRKYKDVPPLEDMIEGDHPWMTAVNSGILVCDTPVAELLSAENKGYIIATSKAFSVLIEFADDPKAMLEIAEWFEEVLADDGHSPDTRPTMPKGVVH